MLFIIIMNNNNHCAVDHIIYHYYQTFPNELVSQLSGSKLSYASSTVGKQMKSGIISVV